MLFNLTLVLQIGNFLIAYYLLSRGLFRPAVVLLERQEQYLANLQAKQVQRLQSLELLTQQQRTITREAALLFAPLLETIQVANTQVWPVTPSLTVSAVPVHLVQQVGQELTAQVVQQVQRA